MKLYEEEYINEKLIRVIHRYLPDLRELSKKIKERPLSTEPIKFKPFNLTVSKPRTTSISKDTVKKEDCRLKSQEQIKLRKLPENKPNQRRAISAIEKSSQNHFRAKPLPNFQTNKIPVKLNLATVLKENQLYKKQEDNIHRRLDYLEAGGKDAHEFLQWQQTMQQQDYEQKLNTIERKKLEGKISYEEGILAKQRLTNENRQIANELKRQTRETIEFHVKEKLKEEQKMKQLIEVIINGRDNTKLAQQKLQQYKTDFVKQYKEDTKQLMKQTLEEVRKIVDLNLLRKTIQAIDIELWNKIEQCDISNLMFAYRWLLLDCKREFPFKDICSVFETLWASLPLDRFELNNNTYSDVDDLCPSSICSYRHISMISSITNTILSSHSYSSIAEENQSEHSSIDGGDSGYRDEQISTIGDLNINYSQQDNITITSCIPLEKWLTKFSNIDNEYDYSDMFTIFLCIALLEQNRSSIMQVSTINIDNDDCIGYYFTRLVRQNDAKQALKLARNYHKQYVVFQMRIKQLLMSNN
ncbi:unnamed protein product [Adineta steineri]|uniref:Uncharacterized protein n=2 Tax=Adineta steineri TaxID=433720 RepID=A0A814BUA1_9BILA|nr:unnamed protein product [Adineta steineri]